MDDMGDKIRVFLLIIVPLIFALGCGPLETVSGDRSITYEQDFDAIVETVKKALRGRSLEVSFAEKSDEGDRYTILFHSTEYMNTDAQPTDRGEVIVQRIEEEKTKIIINNPEYPDTIPSHHRKEYDKELKEEIEKMLES